jgi:uncharacterized repeat protein (TIGR01451 family)
MDSSRRSRRAVLVGAALALFCAVPAGAVAPPTIYNVTTTADVMDSPAVGNPGPDGQLSLREAYHWTIDDGIVHDRIVLPPGRYHVTEPMGFVDGIDEVAGSGARNTIIDVSGSGHRVFSVDGVGTSAEFDDLTLTGGSEPNVGGGGLANFNAESTLVLIRTIVTGNSAKYGGGIANFATPTGGDGLRISQSQISGNTAGSTSAGALPEGGGGIWNQGTATIVASTISGNTANPGPASSGRGGGIYTDQGPGADSPRTNLFFSTVTGNMATGASPAGGDLYRNPTIGSPGIVNTLSDIVSNGLPANCNVAMTPALTDNSIDDGSTCGLPRSGVDPKIGPPLDNGGGTDTHALLAGSPAIDSATCAEGVDQRGVVVPQGPACDAGAYELVTSADLALAMAATPSPVSGGGTLTYSITVSSTGPAGDATQPLVTDTLPGGATLVSASASQGTCSGAGILTCALGTVANGSSATITIAVRAPASGSLTNTAHVSAPRPDANAADDSATAVTNVSAAKPRIGSLTLGPKRFRALRAGPSALPAVARGTHVNYVLSQAGHGQIPSRAKGPRPQEREALPQAEQAQPPRPPLHALPQGQRQLHPAGRRRHQPLPLQRPHPQPQAPPGLLPVGGGGWQLRPEARELHDRPRLD